ncbi:MAG: hypothetical protein KF861_16790 [Planctomycetaceae bacterium]|nr:hypothetical protein [Planctomycetaceae bacterium]
MTSVALVRYGMIPEVSRFLVGEELSGLGRGDRVVVRTHRGLLLGTVLEVVGQPALAPVFERVGSDADAAPNDDSPLSPVVRRASADDLRSDEQNRNDTHTAFRDWRNRIAEWNLDLELIDLEWTLDGQKLILYVLNERGPDCTKLALQAAAAGLGIIEVQPVTSDGLVAAPDPSAGGGCGTCGCH